MIRTPAAHLARLKVTNQSWDIRWAAEGTGYRAPRRNERGGLRSIYAPTLPQLEAALAGAGRRQSSEPHRDRHCRVSRLHRPAVIRGVPARV